MKGFQEQLGFVLHTQPFSENSLLVDLLTCGYGRVKCIAKGFRGGRKNGRTNSLFPHSEYNLCWHGKNDLKVLTSAELIGPPVFLDREPLYHGLYLNELIYRLVDCQEYLDGFYSAYRDFISSLILTGADETRLREIEMQLLRELGFGLLLNVDVHSGESVNPENFYKFNPESGFHKALKGDLSDNLFLGKYLLELHAGCWQRREVLMIARIILRKTIDFRLNGKPLHSRRLYRSFLAS